MATESLLKTSKQTKYISYRNILYHRFFVGLLLFIVLSLVFTVLFNVFTASSPRIDFHEPVNLDSTSLEVLELRADLPKSEARFPNCTYWDCFNVYRCGRGGHDKITIYIYPLKDYQTENGRAISQFSREFYVILDTIRHSKYYTSDPDEACLLVPSIDTLNQNSFSSGYVSRALYSLKQ